MAVYDCKGKDSEFYQSYSLRYQPILDECGFSTIDGRVHTHVKTGRRFKVYKRTEDLNSLLTMISDNDNNAIKYSDDEIVTMFNNGKRQI